MTNTEIVHIVKIPSALLEPTSGLETVRKCTNNKGEHKIVFKFSLHIPKTPRTHTETSQEQVSDCCLQTYTGKRWGYYKDMNQTHIHKGSKRRTNSVLHLLYNEQSKRSNLHQYREHL